MLSTDVARWISSEARLIKNSFLLELEGMSRKTKLLSGPDSPLKCISHARKVNRSKVSKIFCFDREIQDLILTVKNF